MSTLFRLYKIIEGVFENKMQREFDSSDSHLAFLQPS